MEFFENDVGRIYNYIEGAWEDLDEEFRRAEDDLEKIVQETLHLIEEGRVIAPKMPRIRTRQRKSRKFDKSVALIKGTRVSRRLSRRSVKKSVLPPAILEDPAELEKASCSSPAEIPTGKRKFFFSTKPCRSYFEPIGENSPEIFSTQAETIPLIQEHEAGMVEAITELPGKVESTAINKKAGGTKDASASNLTKSALNENVEAAGNESNERAVAAHYESNEKFTELAKNMSTGKMITRTACDAAEKVKVANELTRKVKAANEGKAKLANEVKPVNEVTGKVEAGNELTGKRIAVNEVEPANEVTGKVEAGNELTGKGIAVNEVEPANEVTGKVEATNKLNATINATDEPIKKVAAQTRKTVLMGKTNGGKETLRTFQVHVENANNQKDERKTSQILEIEKTQPDFQNGTESTEVDNKDEERRVTRARTKIIKRDKPSSNLPIIDGNGRETKIPLKDIKNAYIPLPKKIGDSSALENLQDKENVHLFVKKAPRQEFGKNPWTPPTNISMGKSNEENTQLKKSTRSKKPTKEVPKTFVQKTLTVTNATAYRDVKRTNTPISDPEDVNNSGAEDEIIIDATIDEAEPAASEYSIEDVGICDETDYEDHPRKDIPNWALRSNRSDFLRLYKYLPSKFLLDWFKTPKLHTKTLGEAIFQRKGRKV